MPKISVLLPLYNTKEDHLREALESVLNQSFRDFELLVLNDSPANQALTRIVEEYKDSRIRLIPNEANMGIAAARNKLVNLAQGEYLAVMDHDDISLPDRLEKQASYLDSHPAVGIVGCWVEEFPVHKIVRYPVEDHDIRLGLMYGCMIPHSGAMIRKSMIESSHIRYEACFSPSEDYAMWCRLLPQTLFHNIPEVLLRYRLHADNTGKKESRQMREATQSIRSMVRTTNPALHLEYLMRARDVTRICLFGFFPLLKITRRDTRYTVYLFDKIPFFSIKRTVKL